jgi:hypothetical protein
MGFTVDIKGNASHLDKTIKNVKTSLSAIGSVATTAATSLASIGVAGGAALTAFIVSSSNAASGMESLTGQFEVLTGSLTKAEGLIKQFREEAIKSPLSVQDYAIAARGFMSYGVAAEKVLPVLKMLGDVSMGNAERFGLLSYAMAQVASNKTLKGDDLRQLVAQGFNPLAEISLKTGKSLEELRGEMEKHKITYEMVESALKDVTGAGGRFYGALEKGSKTTEGKIAKLKDSVLSFQVAFGTGFNKGLKDALDATNNFLPQLESKFKEAGAVVGSALSEGVRGNTEELSLIGGFIGDVIWAGFKAVWLKGMDSLIVNPVSNVARNPLMTPRVIANVIGIQGIDMPDFGNFTQSSPLSSYIQSGIEEGAGSGSLQKLLELQKARQERDNKNFMKEYEESNKWLEGIYKNQSIVGAKFSN